MLELTVSDNILINSIGSAPKETKIYFSILTIIKWNNFHYNTFDVLYMWQEALYMLSLEALK